MSFMFCFVVFICYNQICSILQIINHVLRNVIIHTHVPVRFVYGEGTERERPTFEVS